MIKRFRLRFGKAHRAAMDYKDFLKSTYWHKVRHAKFNQLRRQQKTQSPFCQLCHSRHRLEMHHNTYAHRGDELNHLEDLTLLCHDCHDWHHNRKP